MQELGRSQPELLALINANQAEFLAIMNEPLPPGTDINALMAQMGGGDMGEGDEGGGEPGSSRRSGSGGPPPPFSDVGLLSGCMPLHCLAPHRAAAHHTTPPMQSRLRWS